MQQNNTCQFGFVRYETRIGKFNMFGGSPNRNILVLKCEACDSLVLCLPEQKPLNKIHLRDKTFSQNTSIQGIQEKVSYQCNNRLKFMQTFCQWEATLSAVINSEALRTSRFLLIHATPSKHLETALCLGFRPFHGRNSQEEALQADTLYLATVRQHRYSS